MCAFFVHTYVRTEDELEHRRREKPSPQSLLFPGTSVSAGSTRRRLTRGLAGGVLFCCVFFGGWFGLAARCDEKPSLDLGSVWAGERVALCRAVHSLLRLMLPPPPPPFQRARVYINTAEVLLWVLWDMY